MALCFLVLMMVIIAGKTVLIRFVVHQVQLYSGIVLCIDDLRLGMLYLVIQKNINNLNVLNTQVQSYEFSKTIMFHQLTATIYYFFSINLNKTN